jgi:hypothetical protein
MQNFSSGENYFIQQFQMFKKFNVEAAGTV